MKAEFVFLFLALLFGILFVFLTPPFQVPDEPAHFYRAWQISEGDFVPQGGGAEMPVVTAELAAGYWRLSEHAEERVLISEPRLQKSSGRCEAKRPPGTCRI